jgi:hypothetical protein
MGVTDENGATVVRVVGKGGSVHVALDVHREQGKLSFQTQESFGKRIQVDWIFDADMKHGVQKRADGVTGQIALERAPALDESWPERWGKPVSLFNGRDLTGWKADDSAQSHWEAQSGVLVNRAAGANLLTEDKYQNFKLHIEYLCPEGGNSGVYLRGRYEIQIEYVKPPEDGLHAMGSLYGFVAPSPSRRLRARPGEWETLDIALVGRRVTAFRDGSKILDAEYIPGITGGALDSHEGEPGPIYLQGDHAAGIKFRNITISVPAKK